MTKMCRPRTVWCGTDFCEALNRLYAIPLRAVCVLVLLIQTSLLDYYFIDYIGVVWLLWTLFDSVVVALFIASFVISYKSVAQTLAYVLHFIN